MKTGLTVKITEKSYPSHCGSERNIVLKDLELFAPRGQFVALFGPSGCGKTTLLRCIAGLDHDFQGTVAFGGASPFVGYVFQEPRLLPWMTVRDNMIFVKGHDSPLIDELLAEVGLDKAGSSHANRLSLGMARRAALARALCVEPEVLLLDEPFVSIDPPTARGLRELSAKLLVNRDILTLLVTHDLDEALLLADRVLFLGGAPTRLIADIMVDIDRDKRALSKLRIFREEMLKNHPLISSLL